MMTAVEGAPGLSAEAGAGSRGVAGLASSPLLSMEDDAFRAFHEQTASGLWAYLVGACRDRALADDVMQESYLRLLRATHFVPESEQHRRRYLYRIATNLLRDHARSPRRREDSIEDLELAAPPAGAAQGLRTDMARAFAHLGERERQLLWLAHVEGYTHEEIAATAGVKAKSVRVLLFRARQKLQAVLRDAGLAPAGGEA